MSKTLYKEAQGLSANYGERLDCSVKAIALTTGEGYALAHYALAEEGRKKGEATYFCQTESALDALGYKLEKVKPRYYGNARTAITLARQKMSGRYIVAFRGHIAAMINGEVLDWVAKRRNRITNVYCVTKIN